VELPYKYLANNYWNLDYVLNPPNDREIHPHTYGIDFFNGIFEYAKLTGSFRSSFRWDDAFNERIQKVVGFNTVNYLWDVYKDFHLFGVLFLPFLCGLGLTVLHLRLCRPFTPRQILMYTYFIYFVGWWFFTSGYKQGIYCIWGMVIFTVSTICSTKKKTLLRKLDLTKPSLTDSVALEK
jgi:oligosaccharide repeat unit polymerase